MDNFASRVTIFFLPTFLILLSTFGGGGCTIKFRNGCGQPILLSHNPNIGNQILFYQPLQITPQLDAIQIFNPVIWSGRFFSQANCPISVSMVNNNAECSVDSPLQAVYNYGQSANQASIEPSICPVATCDIIKNGTCGENLPNMGGSSLRPCSSVDVWITFCPSQIAVDYKSPPITMAAPAIPAYGLGRRVEYPGSMAHHIKSVPVESAGEVPWLAALATGAASSSSSSAASLQSVMAAAAILFFFFLVTSL